MPQFEYTPYRAPLTDSIGALLLRPGEIEAQRATAVAAAQARAAEQKGAAIGGAVQAVGQDVAGAIRTQHDPQRQMAELQVAEAKRQNKSTNVMEAALRDPSNFNPDGTTNDAKIAETLKKQDIGAWQHWTAISAANQKNQIDLHKSILDLQASGLSLEEKQQAARQKQTDYLAELAYHGKEILAQNPTDRNHVQDTVMATVARAAADGAVSPDQAKAFLLQVTKADPLKMGDVFDAAITPTVKARLDAAKLAGQKTEADIAHTQAETVALAHPKLPNSQESDFQLDGKLVKGDYIPGVNGQPGRYFFNGQDVTSRALPKPSSGVAMTDLNISPKAMDFVSEMGLSGKNVQEIIPSFSGIVGAKAKAAFIENLAQHANTLGLNGHDVAAILTDSKAKQAAYTQAQKIGTQTVINESNAKKNFAQLQGLSEKADASVLTTSSALLNDWIRTGVMNFSGQSDDVRNFANVLKSALTEYAKVVSGATTGAGVTEAANAQAQALLNKGITAKTLASFRVQAEKEMANRTSSYDDALKGLFGNIREAGTDDQGKGGLGGESKTEQVVQGGVTYEITRDAKGNITGSKRIGGG